MYMLMHAQKSVARTQMPYSTADEKLLAALPVKARACFGLEEHSLNYYDVTLVLSEESGGEFSIANCVSHKNRDRDQDKMRSLYIHSTLGFASNRGCCCRCI